MVRSHTEQVADWILNAVLILVGLVCVVPLLYVLSLSLTPFSEVLKSGGFILIPRHITLGAYRELFTQNYIPQSLWVTVKLTVAGTVINMLLTVSLAYPLSRKYLPGRTFFLLYIVFTMLFNGGMIPTYLLVKQLNLINTLWAMILPNAVWTFNTLILKSFFESLPEELLESARIDGAGELRILVQIVIPLSVPALMTVMLFYLVSHWNEFFQAIMYVNQKNLYPLQVVVRQILTQSTSSENVDITIPSQTLQSAIVIFASLPVIAVYPFIQKYFTKGMMLGAIKG